MKIDTLSNNVVRIMTAIAQNEGIRKMLLHNVSDPFQPNLPDTDYMNIINPAHQLCKIKPYPFDTDAQVEDGSFIRVYYAEGKFDQSETILESTFHIDIIVAKELWLIKGGKIRPYELMDRIIDMIGARAVGTGIKLNIDGFQHLAVSTKFDAIRLYSDYMSVEA
ncbi:tail completion protein [Bacillus phage vB_BanS-Thrax5]|nr:tail completion protein [Bacillus phage vB_BanS-Thrax5]